MPFRNAEFQFLRRGIADDPEVEVFVDRDLSFAVLQPRPIVDYSNYMPRQSKLGLSKYKQNLNVVDRRFSRIRDQFPPSGTLLEIGASDGAFLAKLRTERPALKLVTVEPDQSTLESRRAVPLHGDYSDFVEAEQAGLQADIVCLFHVFEHIAEPDIFLSAIDRLLSPGGRLIIEVPSLDDPLLSLYQSESYQAFYFQRQHPQVYSARSLRLVLESLGWRVREMRPYQRYGIENHLTWLKDHRPGGNPLFSEIFSEVDGAYRAALEAHGSTDTVFAIAERG